MKDEALKYVRGVRYSNVADTTTLYIEGAIVPSSCDKWSDSDVRLIDIRNIVQESSNKNLVINVSSYGGSVSEGLAIHDYFKSLENSGYTLRTQGYGFICSAATYILSCTKNSFISKNAVYMIHNAQTESYGDINQIERDLESLKVINGRIINLYKGLTNLTEEEIITYMNNETWFKAEETVKLGFVSELSDALLVTNKISEKDFPFKNKEILKIYNHNIMKEEKTMIGKAIDILNSVVYPKSKTEEIPTQVEKEESNNEPPKEEGVEENKTQEGVEEATNTISKEEFDTFKNEVSEAINKMVELAQNQAKAMDKATNSMKEQIVNNIKPIPASNSANEKQEEDLIGVFDEY